MNQSSGHGLWLLGAGTAVAAAAFAFAPLSLQPPPPSAPPPPPPPGDTEPLSPEQIRARGKCVGISATIDPNRRGLVMLIRAWEDGSFDTRMVGAEAFTPSDDWRPVR